MAKVKFAPDVESISGKLCSRSGVIYAVNKQTGVTHRMERHEYSDANTEVQQTLRKTFSSMSKLASAWWKTNKPSDKQPKGSENYQLLMKAYKSQHKIGNPYSYMRALVTDDMKVKLGDLDITGSVTAGGTGSQGGSPSTGNSGSQTAGGTGSQGAGGTGEGGEG
jgi:hypothetical protein